MRSCEYNRGRTHGTWIPILEAGAEESSKFCDLGLCCLSPGKLLKVCQVPKLQNCIQLCSASFWFILALGSA